MLNMNVTELFNRFNLPRSFYSSSEYPRNGDCDLYFERETPSSSDGFQSEILIGRIVYKDQSNHTKRSSSLLVKIFPPSFQRSTYTELTFTNEIFVYTKILPFYATLNHSIWDLFPKFFFGDLIFGDNEDGCVVLENLRESGYLAPKAKIFLDVEHLSLMMKKLGEFHAYSYLAKSTQPERFHSLVGGLIESNFVVLKIMPSFIQQIHQIYVKLLSDDERYADKMEKLNIIHDADAFCEEVFTTRNEPTAVLCHGDFLRNNVLFRYDDQMNPIDMKFIDVANMRYCTPVVDLGLVLYMNTDQQTRDKYWDHLLDVYYESLRNTFPNNIIPTKNHILSEFQRNVLQPYFFAMFFVPEMLEAEKIDGFWFDYLLSASGYDEYVGKSITSIPLFVIVDAITKIHVGENSEVVLDIIRDILNKNFI